jgi:hypothetical protein
MPGCRRTARPRPLVTFLRLHSHLQLGYDYYLLERKFSASGENWPPGRPE